MKLRALVDFRTRWHILMHEVRLEGQARKFKTTREKFRKISKPLEVAEDL